MKITKKLNELKDLKDCGDLITISALGSPLMNAENMHRIALFRKGKECGTTIPLILYHGFKLRYIESLEMSSEPEGIDAVVHQTLRQLLSDVHAIASSEKDSDEILVSKSFQEILFRYIVWKEPLMVKSGESLLRNDKVDRSHTVSGTRCPSCSLSSYLCRWILEKDNLNPKGSFLQINSYVKKLAREIFIHLKDYPEKSWKKKTSFSRRVQNAIFLVAFEKSMSKELFSMPLKNPTKKH